MTDATKGTLIIIGGHEAKEGSCTILSEVARRAQAGSGRLVLMTVATNDPEEMAKEYVTIFNRLGVDDIEVLDVRTRDEARDEANVAKLADAAVIFFTGGDQLRITSQIGDSPTFQEMHARYRDGATIVGTSAGAAAAPETMLTSGPGDESLKVDAVSMAPGLGLLQGVVIDSHFAERGRISRLLGAVTTNPRNLGIGIDEDTAIVVEPDDCFKVIGSGAVYVVDGSTITDSSLSERNANGIVTIHDVTLHVLGAEDAFDLAQRRPLPQSEHEPA